MNTNTFIRTNNIGQGSLVKFKNDDKEYTIKNISPNRVDVFVTLNHQQTYMKSIKNIILVNRNPVKLSESEEKLLDLNEDNIMDNIDTTKDKDLMVKHKEILLDNPESMEEDMFNSSNEELFVKELEEKASDVPINKEREIILQKRNFDDLIERVQDELFNLEDNSANTEVIQGLKKIISNFEQLKGMLSSNTVVNTESINETEENTDDILLAQLAIDFLFNKENNGLKLITSDLDVEKTIERELETAEYDKENSVTIPQYRSDYDLEYKGKKFTFSIYGTADYIIKYVKDPGTEYAPNLVDSDIRLSHRNYTQVLINDEDVTLTEEMANTLKSKYNK